MKNIYTKNEDSSKNQKMFLFVTGDRYPDGDAGAVRTHSFSKLLIKCGIAPVVIGMGFTTISNPDYYDGVQYYSMRAHRQNVLSRIQARIAYNKNLKQILEKMDLSLFCGIMYISGGKGSLDTLKEISRQYSIPLYYDAVEWYSPCEFKLGKWDPFYRRNNLQNKKEIDATVNVIAISTYLEKYYLEKGIHTLRMPAILGVKDIPHKTKFNAGNAIEIVYIGSPGRKDNLGTIINALEILDHSISNRFHFNIIGISEEQYRKISGPVRDELLDGVVFFRGRVQRYEALEYLEKADFAVLIRPSEERYAKAGFPTKVAESMAYGVPMLCNYSSDLSMYLRDGENSIIAKNSTVESCAEALVKLSSLSREDMKRMSVSARATAEMYFDWRQYCRDFEEFISGSADRLHENIADWRCTCRGPKRD